MKFLGAINDVLSLIPALVWAVVLALVGLLWWSTSADLANARRERDDARTAIAALQGGVKQMKADAKARYDVLLAERDAQQKLMNEARRAQEIQDGNAKATIERQRTQLAALSRAGGGGGLRDPYAEACRPRGGGGGAPGHVAAGAGGGAGDAAEAGGLLSAPLEGLLLELTLEADVVNRAYAACRADALTVRGQPELPVSVPAEDPVSTQGAIR